MQGGTYRFAFRVSAHLATVRPTGRIFAGARRRAITRNTGDPPDGSSDSAAVPPHVELLRRSHTRNRCVLDPTLCTTNSAWVGARYLRYRKLIASNRLCLRPAPCPSLAGGLRQAIVAACTDEVRPHTAAGLTRLSLRSRRLARNKPAAMRWAPRRGRGVMHGLLPIVLLLSVLSSACQGEGSALTMSHCTHVVGP